MSRSRRCLEILSCILIISLASCEPAKVKISGNEVANNKAVSNSDADDTQEPSIPPVKADAEVLAPTESPQPTPDLTAPLLSALTAENRKISLAYNETLDSSTVPDAASFEFSGDLLGNSISSIVINSQQVEINLANPVQVQQNLMISYVAGENAIVDLAGNPAASFSTQAIANLELDDEQAPSAGATPRIFNLFSKSLLLSWGAAKDNTTSHSALEYLVCRGNHISDVNSIQGCLEAHIAMPWAGDTLRLQDQSLSSKTQYHYNVLVRDASNNISSFGSASVHTKPIVSSFDVASYNSCAILQGGELFCWGDNWSGQLGGNAGEHRAEPFRIGVDSDWLSVSLGSGFFCGIKTDYQLYCWGYNIWGNVGSGTSGENNIFPPVKVGVDSDWKQVELGSMNTCALKLNGALYCWGSLRGESHLLPSQIGTDLDWIKMDTGGDRVCAIKSNGTLHCFGSNSNYALGDGTDTDRYNPVQLGTGTDWRDVSLGGGHSCALNASDQLFCWGQNSDGQIGLGYADYNDISTPTRVGSDSDWANVAVGDYHTCATKNDGSLYCWGYNLYRALGLRSENTYVTSPSLVMGPDSSWSLVKAGANHNCALKIDSTLHCWGSNQFGQPGFYAYHTNGPLGFSIPGRFSIPQQVGTAYDWSSIHLGDASVCALKRNGIVYCKGRNDEGQLGDGSYEHNFILTTVQGAVSLKSLAAGELHYCGINSDNSLYCWGDNDYGQLGDTTTDSRNVPTKIGIDLDWKEVKAGRQHSCGIKNGGDLYCWGDNWYGALGDGSMVSKSIPTRIGSNNNWVNVNPGNDYTCAVNSLGELYCWGDNDHGKLGDGSTIDKNVPTRIGPDTDWVDVVAYESHSCGLKSDGLIFCWGNNGQGQLGDGTNIERLQPVQIAIDHQWKAIASRGRNAYHSCAIDTNDALYCWGNNSDGQLGIGSFDTVYNTPQRVGSDADWLQVSVGDYQTCGIKTNGFAYCWGGASDMGFNGEQYDFRARVPKFVDFVSP